MNRKLTYPIVGAALFACASLSQAQPTAHYVPGTEGLLAASLPPPGVYLRDYNLAYYADQVNDTHGNDLHAGVKAFVYANAPRLIWITPVELPGIGGNLGVDALVPIEYRWIKGVNEQFGVGDFFFEGTWSRHWSQFDVSAGYGAWVPTGDSNTETEAGLGYWGHMFTAGATYYLDPDKKFSFSALGRYEINTFHHGVRIGDALTIEGGLGYALNKTVTIGPVGYYQQKITEDKGNGSTGRDRVAGIGPEVSANLPWLGGFNASLRYCYEFMAEGASVPPGRLQGHTIALTLTKKF
jgi:hypothetical protein